MDSWGTVYSNARDYSGEKGLLYGLLLLVNVLNINQMIGDSGVNDDKFIIDWNRR